MVQNLNVGFVNLSSSINIEHFETLQLSLDKTNGLPSLRILNRSKPDYVPSAVTITVKRPIIQ